MLKIDYTTSDQCHVANVLFRPGSRGIVELGTVPADGTMTAGRSLVAIDRRRIARGLERSFAVRDKREGMRGPFSGYTTRYRDSGLVTPP